MRNRYIWLFIRSVGIQNQPNWLHFPWNSSGTDYTKHYIMKFKLEFQTAINQIMIAFSRKREEFAYLVQINICIWNVSIKSIIQPNNFTINSTSQIFSCIPWYQSSWIKFMLFCLVDIQFIKRSTSFFFTKIPKNASKFT